MLTGDKTAVAQAVAGELGLDEYRAELLPADKVSAVEEMLKTGSPLVFVGDGINDAPVLARADVGVAMGASGSDAAIEAADIVLMDDAPVKLALAVRLSRRTMKIVWQNVIFALAVKAIVLVMGATGDAKYVGRCLCRCRRAGAGDPQRHARGTARSTVMKPPLPASVIRIALFGRSAFWQAVLAALACMPKENRAKILLAAYLLLWEVSSMRQITGAAIFHAGRKMPCNSRGHCIAHRRENGLSGCECQALRGYPSGAGKKTGGSAFFAGSAPYLLRGK